MAKKKSEREALKSKAFDLFLNTDKTQKEIAELLCIAEKTISDWKTKENWEELKGANSITSAKIIKNLLNRAYNLSLVENVDADKLIKITNSIEKLSDRKITISQSINVFKEFNSWAHGKDSELVKKINLLQQEFINYKLSS